MTPRLLPLLALLLLASGSLIAQVAQRDSSSPTAPVGGVAWQRSLEDGLALSEASGKPLLVCVNNDGELASDSLASGRYRDPAFLELMEGFVPLLASPVTHSPRSHDGRGVRIPCPRFGQIVCSEHIGLEPLVYERWFQGTRVAPRHVAISPGGEVLFDLYLLSSLSVLDTALKKHGKFNGPLRLPRSNDRRKLLASPDGAARQRLEALFVAADARSREKLVGDAVASKREVQHPELVRLGLEDVVESVRMAAGEAVERHPQGLPVDLLVQAAREVHGDEDAVQTIAEELRQRVDDAGAVRFGTLLGAVFQPSAALDERRWERALGVARETRMGGERGGRGSAGASDHALDPDSSAADEEVLMARVAELDAALSLTSKRTKTRAKGHAKAQIEGHTELAHLYLSLGRLRQAAGQEDIQYELDLARAEAQLVTDLAGKRAPIQSRAVLARADWLSYVPAAESADAVSQLLPDLLPDAHSVLSAELLDTLAQARAEQAMADDSAPLEATWIADLAASCRLLMAHPRSTVWQRVAALDVLGALQLDGLHTALTRQALARDPMLPELHEHLRWHLLRDGDAAQVGAAYAELAKQAEPGQQSRLGWFTSFAQLHAADQLRGDGRLDDSQALYLLSVEGFAATLDDPALVGGKDYMSLAHAGFAALHLVRGETQQAAESLLAAAELSRTALDLPDALGVTPRATAQQIVVALRRAGSKKLAASLQEILEASAAKS